MQLKDGTYAPGSTTILGQLDKPFLVKWANNLGKKGIDSTEYTNEKAKIGELIHRIIQSHLLHTELDVSNYTDEELVIAEKAFYRYLDWERQHIIEDIEVEKELVSETYKYGGLLDIYCKVDGLWTVIDIKTSKSINIEQEIQVASYEMLVRENNLKVEQLLIINPGKEDNSKLLTKEITFNDSIKYFKLFKSLIDVYYIKKEIGWKE